MGDPSLLKKFQKWCDIASFRRWEQSLLGKNDLDWMSSNTTSLDSGVLIPFFQQKQLFHSKSYMLLPQIPYEPIYIQRVNSTNRVSLLDFCFRLGRNSLTFPGLGRLTVGTKALSCRMFFGPFETCEGHGGWRMYRAQAATLLPPSGQSEKPDFSQPIFLSTIVDSYCLVRFTGGYSRQSAISFARDLAI